MTPDFAVAGDPSAPSVPSVPSARFTRGVKVCYCVRMRIHTDTLTRQDIMSAARAARATWAITEHASRSHERAFEVKLRGESNRPNFYDGDGLYAATWDQWGVFFGHLYRQDPRMVTGSVKRPAYADADHFHACTFARFALAGFPADYHGDHTFRYSGVPFVQACTTCDAMQTWAPEALPKPEPVGLFD